MLKSESLKSTLKFGKARGSLLAFGILTAFLTVLPSAFGQDFTLQAAPFSPFAVAPGADSASNITVTGLNGFNGAVDLTCEVTSQTAGIPPTCVISPTPVQASGGATATLTTTISTTPALYTITVTGTGPSGPALTASQNLTVLAVAPQFTITIATAVAPSSVPAGNGAEGTISVNPINGYVSPGYPTVGVTLSCTTITPLVTIPPVCSFAYPPGMTSLPVNGVPATSTITISTYGPVTTVAAPRPRNFNALWLCLPLPLLALAGLGAATGEKRSRKVWGLLSVFVLGAAVLLMPACFNANSTTSTPNGITPNNTYTFTVTGVDADGNISSNTGTTTTNPSVSLTVTTPTN